MALAEALFQKAKELMTAGNYHLACPMLSESQRLDPGGGTLLALGLCNERDGRTATAWAELSEARAIARKERQPQREAVAAEALARLGIRLSRLTVVVPDQAPAGLEVRCDGALLPKAAWGLAMPIDPGPHEVAAVAPGRAAWSTTVTLKPNADKKTIEVPALAEATTPVVLSTPPPALVAPVRVAANPPPEPSSAPSPRLRVLGISLGALGLAGIGGGAIVGLKAMADHDAAVARCPHSPCSDLQGVRLNGQTRTEATVSTELLAGGLAVLGTGVALFVLSPKPDAPRIRAAAGPCAIGLELVGVTR